MMRKRKVEMISLDEIQQIIRENKEMMKKIKRLERRIDELKQEKKAIEDEYKEYKTRHPESVGVKHGKPYSIMIPKKSSKKKKSGAIKGHKGFFRRIPTEIDEEIVVPVVTCPHCSGKNLSEKVQETRSRIVEDIPIVKPNITLYYIERRYCRDCKRIVESPIIQALSKRRIGLRTMLTIVYLKIGLRVPVKGIVRLMRRVFNIKLSEGEICLIQKHIAKAFGPYYAEILEDLKNAPARNIDETSWRIDGDNMWLWAFISKYSSLFLVAESRSHEVPLDVLGKKHTGVDIHDRLKAYDTLAKITKNPQQICWAHLANAQE